jgi:membrane-bound serine protease (ClpP class)
MPTVLLTTAFFVFVVGKVVKAHKSKPVTGGEGIVGEEGTAVTDLTPDGKVFVRGEYWDAESPDRVMKGDKVEVIEIKGMQVKVRKKVS